MATPAEKLADSLNEFKIIQDRGIVAIKSNMLSRVHRERLIANGFIEEILKGWYLATIPSTKKGDNTNWYNNYWEFCTQFLNDRFNDNWCSSPEQSLLIHAGSTIIPQQLIIRAPEANNSTISLPDNGSLFLYKAELPGGNERHTINGLQLYTLPASIVRSTPSTFKHNEIDVRTALSMINEPSDLLSILLHGGHSVVAGRIAGAFRNIGRDRVAEAIIGTMRDAGYDVRETDPFDQNSEILLPGRARSPYETRIRLMWQKMRGSIPSYFPANPGMPENVDDYMKAVDEVFVTDAYHSLSIERYKVTPALIEKVRAGVWDAANDGEDLKQRDATAAKGYLDAFKIVEASIRKILAGANAGTIADDDHGQWYSKLFGPSVTAGILKASDLAGYRIHQVYIGNSMHTPLSRDAIRDAMPVLFELLTNEPDATVRAVLGHFIFVFIHPYMDGNGRVGRFLMNVMLASGGYPWTVIPVENRDDYMQALEQASVHGNIKPFAAFLGYLVSEEIKGRTVAKI